MVVTWWIVLFFLHSVKDLKEKVTVTVIVLVWDDVLNTVLPSGKGTYSCTVLSPIWENSVELGHGRSVSQ